jgi:ABC-type transport system involved in multi-copper enzyme maturation permease subunit
MTRLRLRQLGAVIRIEVGRMLLSLRAAPLLVLAGLPVLAAGAMVLASLLLGRKLAEGGVALDAPGRAVIVFAVLYQFILRLVVYAGCLWIFTYLFRGEMLERSLHYYLLSPIRRELLVAGKFVAGWLLACGLFVGSTVLSLAVLQLAAGWGGAAERLLQQPVPGQLLGYAAVTALACLGYGGVFLLLGLLVRNAIVAGLLFWFWESANVFLPPLLKKLSVIFYLQSLLPVAPDLPALAILADPVPAWLAVPGLLLVTAAALAAAGRRIRHLEIAYGGD